MKFNNLNQDIYHLESKVIPEELVKKVSKTLTFMEATYIEILTIKLDTAVKTISRLKVTS